MNRLGLKISCLVVSIVIWVRVASTTDVEQAVHLPLRITGLQSGLTVEGTELPRRVKVRLTGSKLRLLAHRYFNRYIGEVRVNLSDRRPGPEFSRQLGSSHVFTNLQDPVVVSPVQLLMQVDRQETLRVPVVLDQQGGLRAGLGFLVRPAVAPDSVTLSGPSRFFTGEVSVRTQPVDLSRLSESSSFQVDLVVPHPHLRVSSEAVEAEFLLAPLLERTLANVPVVPLVDAGRPEVGVSPPLADVKVSGVADSVRALTGARFTVTVPVGNLAEGVHSLAGQVEGPDWLTILSLEPAEFQVIVGNNPVPPGAADGREDLRE